MSHKIEKISPSAKIKERYYLDFEDGTTVTVSVNQIADYSLFSGRVLSDEEFRLLCSDASLSSAKSQALRMLGARPMSKKEIHDKLAQKGTDEITIETSIEWLEKIGAVDDSDYASLIVRHYAKKGYGISKVKDELFKRGIPREMWDTALLSMPDTTEIILRQLTNKLKGSRDKDNIAKAANALSRRGYSWDEIRTAIESLKIEDEYEW